MALEEAAGMAEELVELLVEAVVALAMYIHHQLLLIIPPVVYLMHLII